MLDNLFLRMLDQDKLGKILKKKGFIWIGETSVVIPDNYLELPFLVDCLAHAIAESYLLAEELRTPFRRRLEPFLLEILAQYAFLTPESSELDLQPVYEALDFHRILDELQEGFRYESLRPSRRIVERLKSMSPFEEKVKDGFILILCKWIAESFFFSKEQVAEIRKLLMAEPWDIDNWLSPGKLIPNHFSKSQLYKLLQAGLVEGIEMTPTVTESREISVTYYKLSRELGDIKDKRAVAERMASRFIESFGIDSSKLSLLVSAVMNCRIHPLTREFEEITPMIKTLEILMIEKMERHYGTPVPSGSLADKLLSKLIEWGMLESDTRIVNQDRDLFEIHYTMKVHSDLMLKDGTVNLLGLAARLSKVTGLSTNALMDVVENARVLDARSGLIHSMEILAEALRGDDRNPSRLRAVETPLIRRILVEQEILFVFKTKKTLRKSYADAERAFTLENMTLEQKVRDLDGTNLGAFGASSDFLEVFPVWAEDPDRWKDISTTLVTLLQQGRIKDIQTTLNSDPLDRKTKSMPRSIRSIILIHLAQLAVGRSQSQLSGDIEVASASIQAIFDLVKYDLEKTAILEWLNLDAAAQGKVYAEQDLEQVGDLLSALIPPAPTDEERTLKGLDERKRRIAQVEELLRLIVDERNAQSVMHKGKVQSGRLLLLSLLNNMAVEAVNAFFFDIRGKARETPLEEHIRLVSELDHDELALIMELIKKAPELLDARCFQFPVRKIEKFVPSFNDELQQARKLRNAAPGD